MTATEKLRALLDERGVEYRKRKDQKGTSICDVTWWGEPGDCEYIDFGMGRSKFVAFDLTPEQAVAATLGSHERTCEYCKDGKFDGQVVMMSNHGWQRINCCPNCGRRMKGGEL